MTADLNLSIAIQLLKSNNPFLVLKPNLNSFDTTIPYLAECLKLNLIKIGIHDLATNGVVREIEALNFVKEVFMFHKEETLVWIEDISCIDDKGSFIHHVLECSSKNLLIVFTGIKEFCRPILSLLPVLEWDTSYTSVNKDFLFTYITKYQNRTTIQVFNTLHFRTYVNIHESVLKYFKELPPVLIEVENEKVAPLNSIIKMATLGIKKGSNINIITNLNYSEHSQLVYCLKEGFNKPILPFFSNTLYERFNKTYNL